MTLVDGFAAACAAHPDRVAVTGPDEQLTYASLDRRSAAVAEQLRRRGCGPGTLVGLCADRTAELVVLLVGVLRSGAAYVPLDPDLPAARLAFIAADAGLRLVVGPSRHRGRVPGASYVAPDDPPGSPVPGRPPGPDDPAYVIYTSGSTGKPKGVVVTHANVTRLFAVTRDDFGIGAGDVWTLFHSYAFDFSVWELWGALLHGGRLVVVPYATSRTPDRFWRLLGDEGVTVLNQTPSAFRQLDAAAAAAGYGPTPLRLVVFGGERLDPAGLARWVDHYGDERPRLVNMYGITETTVHVTAHPLRRADLAAPVSPIGRPLPDLRVHLLDPAGRPVQPGADGELHVGGAGVATGYLGRPALTAERFVPDPWGAPGDRLYRSGDLARELPDGTLAFRGRIDDQVQLRGFRVEPGSVEHALAALPGVRAAAVVVRDADLVAYVAGAGLSAVGLRTALASVLPAHEVPAVVVTVDALPLTGNGKVDRVALAALPVRRRPAELPYSAPVSVAERRVAAAVAEALDVSPVGRTDSFGALGGDSLRAVRVVAALPGLLLPDLLAGDTVGELAARLDPVPSVPSSSNPPAVGEASATQQRLLFLMARSAGAAAAYTIPAVVRLRGPLDRAVLAAALDDLVARHPALRTRLTPTARAVLAEPVPVPGGLLRTVTGTSVAEVVGRPTDPREPPLLRATLLIVGPEEHVLVLGVSHLAADGWSLAVLGRDLGALYAARLAGAALPSPPAATYAEFVGWQRGQRGGPEHWARVLHGAPTVLELSDRPRPPAAAYAGFRVSRPVPAAVRAAADRLARDERASPYAVQLAAFAAVLAARTGRRDLVIGCPAAGRPGAGFDDVVGCFVATLPLRLRWSGSPPFRALVRDAYGVVLGALEHQQVPFEELVAVAGAEREPGRPPLVQVVFAYHGDQRFAPELPGVTVEPLTVDPGTARFDLLVEVTDTPGGTLVSAEADAALFDPAEVGALLDEWVAALGAAVTDPDLPVRTGSPRPPRETAPATPEPAVAVGVPVAGEVEARLAAVWADVLELPAVGREEDFFALGGDSIRALRLVGAARAGGVELSIDDLFRHRTIAALTTATTSPPAAAGTAGPAPPGGTAGPAWGDDPVRLAAADAERLPGGVADAYPMSVLQQGIVFHCQLAEDPTLYHDVVSVRLAGRWDPDALRAALAATAARHDVLRTSFDLGAYSEPLQLVHARVEVPLRVLGPDGTPPGERRRAWWRDEWRHGFDLGAAPLWRAHVLVHADADVDLALSAHHSILDGWSLAALLTEVVRRYGGEPLDPAAPPVRFRDFVAVERAQLTDPAARTFWTRTAGPALPPTPPAPEVGEPGLEPDAVVEVGAELVGGLAELARRRGVPVRSVYLAAHVRASAAVRGVAEVATGVVVHGRPERVGAVDALGLFLNTLPLRATPGDRELVDLAAELTAAEQERLPYRWYPLAEMQRRAGGPLHDSRFTFADFHVLAGLRRLRRLRVLDWWSADRNEIPVSVEVVRHPLTGATAVEVRVTPAAGDARLARALAEAVVAELRQAIRAG